MKSTVVFDRFPFLLRDVLSNHRVRDGSCTHGQIPPGPQVAAPELLPEVRVLLKEDPRRDALEPLDNRTDVLVRAVGEEEVDMVACDLPRENLELPLHRNLAEKVADADGHWPDEHRFPVLRDPDQVDLQVKFGMRPDPVLSHATIIPQPCASPEGEGFPPSPD